ncbi:MAG: hypothetical protein P9F19_15845 [Candidatus Contendobacter sp.]|nr:hypothetical protein [Candidatus Contendobacter sp.]MDG4558844.1 hypothetical protein [Candidatus Contendobacter sp.]
MNAIKFILKWIGILFGLILVFMIGIMLIGTFNMKQDQQEKGGSQKSISAKQIVSPTTTTELTPEEKEKKMFREAEERGQQRRLEQLSALSSAPQPKGSLAIPADKEETCKKLAPFARAVADMRQKGISLQTAEAGTDILLGKQTTPDGMEFAKSIVRAVYKHKLTTENAEMIVVESCKLIVFTSELEKNKR